VKIDTTFLRRRIAILEMAMVGIKLHEDDGDPIYDLYRATCVKEFELVLHQSGKLLRKRLADWFASNREADRIQFKDLFRHAARHDLIALDAAERWLRYRDNLNHTTHGYGEGFVTTTLRLLPDFVKDATALADMIERTNDG